MATDDKLARGLTRQIERLVARSSNEPRQQTFHFALDLLKRKLDGRKIDGPAFNVPLAALMKIVANNPANLSVVTDRLTLGRPGFFHRTSLQTETVGHLRAANGNFRQNEWAIAIDEVQARHGDMSARLWAAPVLFDTHFVTRYLQRTEAEGAERAIDLVETTLPLAVLVRDSALAGGGSHFQPLDVALPAPGGVLCGGTELVDCAALAYKFKMGRRETNWGMDVIAMPTTLQVAISIRTYLPEEILSSGQFSAVTTLRQWYHKHRDEIMTDPRAGLGWGDEPVNANRVRLINELRVLYEEVQQHFNSWRHNLEREGYFSIDFQAVAAEHKVPEWWKRQIAADLIDRYLKSASPNFQRG
jgi:hypothetical protein